MLCKTFVPFRYFRLNWNVEYLDLQEIAYAKHLFFSWNISSLCIFQESSCFLQSFRKYIFLYSSLWLIGTEWIYEPIYYETNEDFKSDIFGLEARHVIIGNVCFSDV